jgi:hypothetical protein
VVVMVVVVVMVMILAMRGSWMSLRPKRMLVMGLFYKVKGLGR